MYPHFTSGGMPGIIDREQFYSFPHKRAPFPLDITSAIFNAGHEYRATCPWTIQSKRKLRDEKATAPADASEQHILGAADRKADLI